MITDILAAEPRRRTSRVGEVQLAKGQTYALTLESESRTHIQVLSGCFWVTVEGHWEDYVATAESPLVLNGRGLIVLEGIDECNVLTRSG
jgi:hypothetical protein